MNPSFSHIALRPETEIRLSSGVWAWQISALVSMFFFTSFSAFDLGFSALFFNGSEFAAARVVQLEIMRLIIWKATVLISVLCLIGAVLGQFGHKLLRISAYQWTYSTFLILIGPVLIVNAGLKNFWGRARPAEVVEFGGPLTFTPALIPADQCDRNCSFVSGEGSGAVALAVVVWVLTEQILSPGLRRWIRGTAVALGVTGSFLRVATGRHFLSDIVFAALIVTGLALALRPILSSGLRTRQ